ncbi:DUF2167 domain-containing protein [Salmonella enterica subsp. enterica]|nr:DUF2167 domain-containing protein [Salmonella enterica subsp. enterica]
MNRRELQHYLLGREGYFSLNLVTDREVLLTMKSLWRKEFSVPSTLEVQHGQRYADFNESTDKMAEYGLATADWRYRWPKVGLLAMLGIALLKFWKVTAIGVVAVGALAGKLLSRKKTAAPAVRFIPEGA